MTAIQIGDVVNMKSIKAEFRDERSQVSMSFSAGRGNEFVLLLLGRQSITGTPVDPAKVLESLGWIGCIEPSDVKILIETHTKEIARLEKIMKRDGVEYDSHVSHLKTKIEKLAQFASDIDAYRKTVV